jgi:hypothetical protein
MRYKTLKRDVFQWKSSYQNVVPSLDHRDKQNLADVNYTRFGTPCAFPQVNGIQNMGSTASARLSHMIFGLNSGKIIYSGKKGYLFSILGKRGTFFPFWEKGIPFFPVGQPALSCLGSISVLYRTTSQIWIWFSSYIT